MLPATSDRMVLRLNMALLPPVIQRYGSGHTRYGIWPDLRLPGLLGTILRPTAALRQRESTAPAVASQPEFGRNRHRWRCLPGAVGDLPRHEGPRLDVSIPTDRGQSDRQKL